MMPHFSIPELIIAMLTWALPGAAVFFLGLRFVRAFERRNDMRAALREMSDRILRLEEAVEVTRDDLARLGERQEFTDDLLGKRLK